MRKVWEQKIFDQHQIKDALSIQNCDKRNWRKGSDEVYFERNFGFLIYFLSDPGVPGVRSMGPVMRMRDFEDLTDVTLADDDTKSILTNQ